MDPKCVESVDKECDGEEPFKTTPVRQPDERRILAASAPVSVFTRWRPKTVDFDIFLQNPGTKRFVGTIRRMRFPLCKLPVQTAPGARQDKTG